MNGRVAGRDKVAEGRQEVGRRQLKDMRKSWDVMESEGKEGK